MSIKVAALFLFIWPFHHKKPEPLPPTDLRSHYDSLAGGITWYEDSRGKANEGPCEKLGNTYFYVRYNSLGMSSKSCQGAILDAITNNYVEEKVTQI